MTSQSVPSGADKQGFPHFMLKEIYEQPAALRAVLCEYLPGHLRINLPEPWYAVEQIHILGCGTSRHAGLVAQYWLEQIANVPTRVRSASEFVVAPWPMTAKTLTIAVTQSGETADTLAAVQQQRRDHPTAALLGITNTPNSTLIDHCDRSLLTLAGREIGVAATKTFTTQLLVFLCLALDLASRRRTITPKFLEQTIAQLHALPDLLEQVLQTQAAAIAFPQTLTDTQNCIVLGQGINQPIALEAALKLKETTYIHAEGYAAGEFLHGPIALLDERIWVIAIGSSAGMMTAIEKVKHCSATVLHVTIGDSREDNWNIPLPAVPEILSPFLTVLPLQLLAYHSAVARGRSVDHPRNLTKAIA